MNRRVLLVLCLAQFLMVLDSAVMNVSISQLVEDFDTSVTTIQLAITFYSLVMAAFMITGGKLGDRWGRKTAFRTGLFIYAIGSGITAIAPNVGILILGWSVIEGIGAALVMPAMVALVASNFSGEKRAAAYGLLGGVAGAGIAVGPILGGWVTTNLTWRLVFAGEVVVAAFILLLSGALVEGVKKAEAKMDWLGSALSAVGLGLVVFAVLQSSAWGWFVPKNSPIEPFGLSLTVFVLLAGIVLLLLFARWQRFCEDSRREPLIHLAMLKVPQLRAGVVMFLSQNTILMGVFFAIPLYLQVVQGFNALETGLRMLPVSVALFLTSMSGPALLRRYSPRLIVRSGLIILGFATVALLALIDPNIANAKFLTAMAFLGIGIGLLASQLGNIVQSAVNEEQRSEAGGLQFTAQQLGASIGTALIGAVVIGSLATSLLNLVQNDPAISDAVRQQVGIQLESGVSFVPVSEAETAMRQAGLSESDITNLSRDYSDAQLQGLRTGLFLAAVIVIISLFFTRDLPKRKFVEIPATASVP